jgi:GTP-binding protein
VVNKWDLVKNKKTYLEELKKSLAKNLSQVPNVPVAVISALNDNNINEVLEKALAIYELWNVRLPTGKLNRWLEILLENNAPPISKGRRIKIRYISQTKSRPPTFMLSVSQPENMPDSYLRYLTGNLRESFGIAGVPIRINMPKKDNPFEKR